MSVDSQTEITNVPEEIANLVRQDEAELEEGLCQIREDISRGGRVDEARAAVKEMEARWPEDPRVQYWAQVLAPPVVVPTPETHRNVRSLEREHTWLRQHRRQYPGCWLAVYEDRLIAADPSLEVVLSESRRVLGDKGALLHWQPGEPKQS